MKIAETIERALQYQYTGCFQQAEDLYRQILRTKADIPEVYNNLGTTLKSQGKIAQAIENYKQAIRLKPDFPEACYNLANAQQAIAKSTSAISNYKHAIRLKPDFAQAYFFLANIQRAEGLFSEAIQNYTRAIQLKPDYFDACNNLGGTLHWQGRYLQAMHHYTRAIELQPDNAQAHYNLALLLLLKGAFTQGWKEFQWRQRGGMTGSAYPHTYQQPRWDGSPFEGKRLLVHYEQGLGDNLQFVRYLPMVKARGGAIIFETPAPLLGLLQAFDGIDELVQALPDKKPDVEFDFHISLLDLPAIFETTDRTIPDNIPYLFAAAQKSYYWRSIVSQGRFKAGIVWAGSPRHGMNQERCCRLDHFASLAKIDGVQLYSLQKGRPTQQLCARAPDMSLINLGQSFADFSDTAAAIENLDLVISVDTSVAHLAGAMGKPVWLLLPFVPDWRWMLSRRDSPWYPTMKLFRQNTQGNWDDVFGRVTEELQKTAGKQMALTRMSQQ